MQFRTDEILEAATARAGNSGMLPPLQREAMMVLLLKMQILMTCGKNAYQKSEFTGVSLLEHFARFSIVAFPDLFKNHMQEYKTLENAFLADLKMVLDSDKKNG